MGCLGTPTGWFERICFPRRGALRYGSRRKPPAPGQGSGKRIVAL